MDPAIERILAEYERRLLDDLARRRSSRPTALLADAGFADEAA